PHPESHSTEKPTRHRTTRNTYDKRNRGLTKPPPGKSQLAKLAHAHTPTPRAQTPRKEDYVEVIYELIHEKGYAKPVDIAKNLHVTPPTVTGMPNKLREEQ